MAEKKLTDKQLIALDLLTCGKGYTYKEVCEIAGIGYRTLWTWRNEADFSHFQEEYKRLMDEKWQATVEAARQAAFELCREKNQKMVEFVLKNDGLNPTNKIEAELNNEVTITIGE